MPRVVCADTDACIEGGRWSVMCPLSVLRCMWPSSGNSELLAMILPLCVCAVMVCNESLMVISPFLVVACTGLCACSMVIDPCSLMCAAIV